MSKDSPDLTPPDPPSRKPPPGFPAAIPRPESLADLHATMVCCTRCDLALSRIQVVPGSGHPQARVMFLGEAPGAREDERGIPFVGRSGELLDQMLDQAGLDREHVFIGNVVRCRPPGNRDPKGPEIQACAGWLEQQLRLVAPRIVATLGRFALQHFVPGAKITQLQGTVVQAPTAFGELRLFPLLHPAAVLRNPRLRESYATHFRLLAEIIGADP